LPPLRHGYVDSPYGQLHYSIARPMAATSLGPARAPIVLLHQSPNSSVEFDALVPALARDRVVLAFDTPGYGGSDGPVGIPTIEDYAGAIVAGLEALGYGADRPVDLFGYHTGSKIATEIANRRPRLVRRLMLSGLYLADEAALAKARAAIVHPASASALFEHFCSLLPRYREMYAASGVPDAAWGRIRIDSLRPITRQEFGHEAAYRYTPVFAARMASVTQPVLLVPLDDGLAAATRAAPALFLKTTAKVTARDFPRGAFFTEPDAVADALRAFADAR
jgi:pimeloyl-ACP methyl ester carboxylesterase